MHTSAMMRIRHSTNRRRLRVADVGDTMDSDRHLRVLRQLRSITEQQCLLTLTL